MKQQFANRLSAAQYVDSYLKTRYNPANPKAFVSDFYDTLATRAYENPHQLSDSNTIYIVYPGKNYEQQKNSYNALTNEGAVLLAKQLQAHHEQSWQGVEDEYQDVAHRLPRETQFEPWQIVMSTNTNRTDASPLERLIKQPLFPSIDPMHGEALIIFDDHSEAGSFTTTLANTAHDVARCVLGVVTLSASPYTQSGLYSAPALQDFVRELLDKRGWAVDIAQFQAHEPDEKRATLTSTDSKYRPSGQQNKLTPSDYFDRELRHMGMSIDTLTTYEALVVAALLIDVNQTEEVQTFKALNPAEHGTTHGAVAKGESASDLISSEPKSAAEIVTQLMHLLPDSRSEA